jgi:hypothetical protein
MPAFLDTRDHRLVLGAVAVMLLLLVLTYFVRPEPEQQQSIGLPTSDSTQWDGARGAFLLLDRLGYRVERWVAAPDELPADAAGTTLVMAEPLESGSEADQAAVARFVSAGGRLLLTGARGVKLAPEASADEVPDWHLDPKPYVALLPSPLTAGAPEISMIAPDKWTSANPSHLAIFGQNDQVAVVAYRFGKGQVIWWASPAPLSNSLIRDKGNLALFLNSVGPRGSRVLWDEYFHGARRSLASYFARTPLPWAGLQIAVAFAALLFTFSRRSGPVRMPASESRLSPLEFVETLGDLFQSAHAAPAAVGIAYQRLRQSLAQRLGIPADAKLPELCRAAAARLGWREEPLFHTLSESERAMRDINLDERVALNLVQQLHDFEQQLESRRKFA